jgi:hypothetical protein
MAISRETVGYPSRNSFKGVAAFQGIEQKLEGYSRPAKNGRSAQDIRIFDDHAVPGTHKVSISGSVALSSRRWLESHTVTANSLPLLVISLKK